MHLQTNHYSFWTDIKEYDDEIDIFLGNPEGSPRPCFAFTIYDRELVLQDVVYYATCSSPKSLDRGSGTVEMIQGACKAILEKYESIDKVYFTDKSYFPGGQRRGGNVPLPELHALVYGATWYQRHFDAVPDIRTVRVLQPYLKRRSYPVNILTNDPASADNTVADFVKSLKFQDEQTLLNIVHALGLKRLTGTAWEIPRAAVLQYPTSATFIKGNRQGGSFVVKRTRSSKPYYPGRVSRANRHG